MLPKDFVDYTAPLFGDKRWLKYLASFSEAVPVSIRVNPFKVSQSDSGKTADENIKDLSSMLSTVGPLLERDVPWCRNAWWLSGRPQFTLDPQFHAGAYYVQESGSMFLDTVLGQYVTSPVTMLDLCAAPGGKSSLARSALPAGSLLFSNEPDRRRANILVENLMKQGHPDVIVTNAYARDYARTRLAFDVILADVPCSGEGLFRRDAKTISEWSVQNVMRCQSLQRDIVCDIWPSLKSGGLFVYSTCTFNTHEDEENVIFIRDQLGAEILSVDTEPSWGITGSLLPSLRSPVYRFIPGATASEGLFMCVMRKKGQSAADSPDKARAVKQAKGLNILYDGTPHPTPKGKSIIPDHAEALLIDQTGRYPRVELSRDDALAYLHHETLVLPPDTPMGYIIVTYYGMPLGFVKNLGRRANNLYPKEWAIKMSIT
ncbi:MAG: hypothetical protein ACI3Y5_01085 [Prevotella sp.]